MSEKTKLDEARAKVNKFTTMYAQINFGEHSKTLDKALALLAQAAEGMNQIKEAHKKANKEIGRLWQEKEKLKQQVEEWKAKK